MAMMITSTPPPPIVLASHRGRNITQDDIDFIRELIAAHPGASRRRLSALLCEAWGWRQANGCLRDMVCRSLMLELHRAGLIELPAKVRSPSNPLTQRPTPPALDEDGDLFAQTPMQCSLRELGPLRIEQVRRTPAETEPAPPPNEKTPSRTGVFTSAIVSRAKGHTIALFATGARHAGENLERRRRELREVYGHDAHCREQGLSPPERLAWHQEHSGPLLKELRAWMEARFEERLVEPNSGLGEAIRYMLKHGVALTLFLRVPAAPLDNNVCEQALKMAIRSRKNSLFYKTEHGAQVGDLFMSLIHTCQLNRVNPFDYLVRLQRHSADLRRNPAAWMPWNYQRALAALEPAPVTPAS